MLNYFKKNKNNNVSATDNISGASEYIKPGFMIIGAQKAGTTALYKYLSKHPCVLTAKHKELNFFSCESKFNRGVDYYHSLFPLAEPDQSGVITFDDSPDYFVKPGASKRIFEYNPNIKLIAILRDPVERAFSAWNMYKKYYKKDESWFHNWMTRCDDRYDKSKSVQRDLKRFVSFGYAIREELEAIQQDKKKDMFASIEAPLLLHGQYAEQAERFLNLFDKDQLLILENRSFGADTAGLLRNIENFLNLTGHDWESEDLSPVLKGEYEDEISAETRSLLREYYKPFNEKLFELLGESYDW